MPHPPPSPDQSPMGEGRQPSYGQQPPGSDDAQRRRFVNAVVVISAIVLAIIYFANEEDDTAGTSSTNTSFSRVPASPAPGEVAAPAAPPPPANDIGRPVRDGQFEFVVTALDGSTAQLTVTNIGDHPKTMDAGEQILMDVQGREFAPSVSILSDIYYETLNPGESASGSLMYELSGAVPDHLELHDSAFSDGVEVALG